MDVFLSRSDVMDDRNYKNYKVPLTHSKVTTTSISPYLIHLNGTFFASSVFHEMLTEHYDVQETIHVLKLNDP